MGATNVNATVKETSPLAGASLQGYKLGWLVATAKGAANDTITITNASSILFASLKLVSDGTQEQCTISTNILTMTKAVTTGDVVGYIIYKS
jgi:hypothetical protein